MFTSYSQYQHMAAVWSATNKYIIYQRKYYFNNILSISYIRK